MIIPFPKNEAARIPALAAALGLLLAGASATQQVPATGDGPASCGKPPAEIYRLVGPAVVQVMTLGISPFQLADRVQAGMGSGVALGDDLVVTNFHVVVDASTIAIAAGETIKEATLVGRDPVLDIAILRAPGLGALTTAIELAPSDDLVVGQPAYAIGFPLGGDKSLTTGIVSGLERQLPLNRFSWLSPFIQTDAAVSAGNSGGALVDDCGRMIGMVTLHSEAPEAEDIGFAIPVRTLRRLLPELIETGRVARPWHGLYGQMVTPVILHLLGADPFAFLFAQGFLVETVEPGSAADKAGIRGGSLPVLWGMQQIVLGGDIITQVNGHRIGSLEDARAAVQSLEIGQTVTVRLLRDGEEMEVSATIEERPILPRDIEVYRN